MCGDWPTCRRQPSPFESGHTLLRIFPRRRTINANCRLISTAPELLQSCEELFALVVCPENFTEDQRQDILDSARAARAKATGSPTVSTIRRSSEEFSAETFAAARAALAKFDA